MLVVLDIFQLLFHRENSKQLQYHSDINWATITLVTQTETVWLMLCNHTDLEPLGV